jgi:hypothetical protein
MLPLRVSEEIVTPTADVLRALRASKAQYQLAGIYAPSVQLVDLSR